MTARAETDGDSDTSKELQKDTQTLCIVTNPRVTWDFRADIPCVLYGITQILDPLPGHKLHVAWICG